MTGRCDLAMSRAIGRAPLSRELIPKHERRFTGFDDKILALYARGHDGP